MVMSLMFICGFVVSNVVDGNIWFLVFILFVCDFYIMILFFFFFIG